MDRGLSVERRFAIDKNYSSEFGLVVVSGAAEERPMLLTTGETEIEGFLIEATAAATNACRKVLERVVLGSYSKSTEISPDILRERRECLARQIIEIGLRPGDLNPSDIDILTGMVPQLVSPELGQRALEPFHVFVNTLIDRLRNMRVQEEHTNA